ncbi:MAG: hydroxyethylthiazole kinase [Lachnospiraceae bacterium]
MKRSARTAAKEGIPVLLDLVGVSCSKIRMELAMELIEKGKIQILKGNISELLAIAGQPFHGTGIDAGAEDAMTGDNEEERKEIFRKVSKKTGSVLLATGAKDLLVDQNRCLILDNGVPELSGITGTGCMVGALSAAFLAQRSVCGGTAWDFGDGNRRGDRRKEVNRTGKLSDGTSGCGGRADTGRTGGKDPDSGDWNIKWS